MPVHSTDNNDRASEIIKSEEPVSDLSNDNFEDELDSEEYHDYTFIRNAIKNGLFHYKNAAALAELLADDDDSDEEDEEDSEDEVDSEEHHDYTFIRDAIKKGLFHYKNAAVLAKLLADDDDSEDEEEDSFLPTPNITNLKQIKERLLAVEADRQVQRKMKDYIVEEEYIDKFIPVLETCESMELTSTLSTLYDILMHLINIGDASIMDQIVKDGTFECCLGILENEINFANGKANYRRMFSGHREDRLLFPIDDPYTFRTMHQLHRLQFLEETALPENPNLDKETAEMLRLMIKSKMVEIVQDIGFDQNFMDGLFDVMTNDTEPMRRRQDVVLFVHQLCSMAKMTKVDIYKKLDPFDFMRLLEFAAGADNTRVKQAGIEILQSALDTNPNFIRSHIARRPSTNSFKGFFDTIINQSLTETDVCILPHFTESIRTLFDIKSELTDKDNEDDEDLLSERTVVKRLPSERTVAKRLLDLTPNDEKFLSVFYERYLSSLVTPLLQLTKATTALDPVTYARCESACSLLSSAVRIHPERIKDLLVSSRVSEKLCLLFKNDSKHMRLMALNFFRLCLKHKENCFNQMLVRDKVIHEVIGIIQETKGSGNVLDTVCLDFIGFIRKNNVKFLISHIEEVYKETIKGLQYIPEIKKMLALQNGSHDAGAEEKAYEAMIVSRLQEIPLAHLRPLFNDTRRKRQETDLEETPDSHVNKKQRTRDISGMAIAPSPPRRRRTLKDADLEESADAASQAHKRRRTQVV